MNTPFIFGTIATGENYTDRETETRHLVDNFNALTNTIIISPRRWGKSSLVHRAGKIAAEKNKDLRICFIDLFNVRDEMHFYELFAQKVIAATATKWDEVIENTKKLIGGVIPRLSLSDGIGSGISFDFKFDKNDLDPDKILDLPEKLAEKKNIKIIVCIDEFQNIGDFKDADYIYRRLRSHWQLHQNVAYCLFGSKRHMMMEIFSNSSKPFYKFGDLFFLNKISRQYWIPFFMDRFKETGKELDAENADLIAALVEDHPYYCQQLAQIAWLRTNDVCTRDIINESHVVLREQLSLIFENITSLLSDQQVAYLHALIDGNEKLTSMEVMQKYGIKSSTASLRAKASLIDNDILDVISGKIYFQDPLYQFWLRSIYFAT